MGLFDWFIDMDGNGRVDEFDLILAMALMENDDENEDDFDLYDDLESF